MISISFIIVNFYCEEEILRCINSIFEETKKISNFEIIVVSNSPISDSFKEELKDKSKVKLIISEKNNGFACGCNQGAAKAKGAHLFFLNPDTRLLNDAASDLLNRYSQLPKPGIIAPFTYSKKGDLEPSVKNHLNFITLLNDAVPFLTFFLPQTYKSGHYKVQKTSEVDVVNGSAMFISKKLFENLNGMDEQFFMYWEENDLCLRANKRGYRMYIVNTAKIEHIGAITTNPKFYEMFLIQHASKKLFLQKHYPNYLTLNRIAGIIAYAWRTIGAIVVGNTKKIKQFYLAFKWYTFSYETDDRIKFIDTLSAS